MRTASEVKNEITKDIHISILKDALNDLRMANVLLYTPIPDGTDGTQLVITNGTISEPVLAFNGNYYRPLPLRSRTILRVQYLDDPGHFQLIGIRR